MISSLLINFGFFLLASLGFFSMHATLILSLCRRLETPRLRVDPRLKPASFGVPPAALPRAGLRARAAGTTPGLL